MPCFRFDLGGRRTEHVGHRRRLHARSTMTDGLVAIGDCVVQLKSGKGLVTSSGSTPGLVVRTSADPNPLRKVTSESVDDSCIIASVLGH